MLIRKDYEIFSEMNNGRIGKADMSLRLQGAGNKMTGILITWGYASQNA